MITFKTGLSWLFLTLILTGCATLPPSPPARKEVQLPAPFSERRDAIFSPAGSVPFHQAAYSPDGRFFAREVEPFNEGNIGIFSTADGALIRQIKAHQATNDLKGLAWSPDSQLLAVMYHGGSSTGISIYLAENGELIRQLPIAQYYHFMAFGEENHILHLAVSIDGPVETAYLRRDDFTTFCGVNLPWINYGWDVGRNPWGSKHGGFSSNRERLLEDFSMLARHRVAVVRVFIFCDLRSGIVFNGQGEPAGLDGFALSDFQTLLETASQTGVKLLPVIFDYTMADGVEQENGTPVGEHRGCIENVYLRRKLLTVLAPFFRKFGQHPAILAWDIFNEPDNVLLVRSDDVDRFIAETILLLRQVAPRAKVTVGNKNRESLSRWRNLNLDFLQFHHFSSAEALPPLESRKEIFLPARPVLVGECPPSTVLSQLEAAWQGNYAGCLFWSLNDVLNEEESLRQQLPSFRAWVSVH